VDLKQIKELMTAMERAGMKKLAIKEKTGYEIHLERHDEHPHPAAAPIAVAYPHAFAAPAPHAKEHETHPRHPASQSPAGVKAAPAEKEGRFVSAPLVGTFYSSPSPDDPVFVKVGDRVEENTVICIIEAMKVMNEVKAGLSGMVAEILVENAHPVEFGTKMFRIV